LDLQRTARLHEPGQAAASVSQQVDFTMNSSRVWQTFYLVGDRTQKFGYGINAIFPIVAVLWCYVQYHAAAQLSIK
jgi:hypothetical protein